MSSIASTFHSCPHYNFHFQPVSSNFDVENSDYRAALVQLALPLSVAAVIITIIYLFIMCACCCCKSKAFRSYRPSRAVYGKFMMFLCVLFIVGAVALGSYGTATLNKAVDGFTTHTSNASNLLDTLQSMCTNTSSQALSDSYFIAQLPVQPQDQQYRDTVVRNLQVLSQQLSDAANKLSGTIRVDKWNSDINHYDRLRFIAMVTMNGCIFFVAVVTAICVMCRSYGLTRCMSVLVLLAFLFCWIIGSVFFSGTVAMSDFCVDPNTAVTNQIHDSDAAYYINCDSSTAFPYQSYFANADQALYEARQAVQSLMQYGNFTPMVDAYALAINTLHSRALCTGGLHDEYVGAVNDMCGDDGLRSVLFVTVSVLGSGLFFLLMLCVMHPIIQSLDPETNYYHTSLNDERSLLISSRTAGYYGTGSTTLGSSYSSTSFSNSNSAPTWASAGSSSSSSGYGYKNLS